MQRAYAWLGSIAILAWTSSVASAETINCTAINALPIVITVQGVYCLKKDLVTSMTSGTAILVNANNVIIDLNGYKLGGLAAGAGTTAYGIAAYDRQNVTIFNGSVRGFFNNIYLNNGLGHIVEDMRIDGARSNGLFLSGINLVARNNFITATGTGVGLSASGILVDSGYNLSITGNFISGVSESQSANGIRLENAYQTVVEDNEVHEIASTGAANGIYVSNGVQNVIRNNVVFGSGGTTGIGAWSSNDACIGNLVSNGYATPLAGCSVSNGNQLY